MPSVFRALENDCRRQTKANLPLWLCGSFSFLLTLAPPAVFWLLVGPGYGLIPTGIFMVLTLAFAAIFDDDWEEGNPASLWLGLAAVALSFTIMAANGAVFVSWWLAILAPVGGVIFWYGIRESINYANSSSSGWSESVKIVNGTFRHPLLVAVTVQLAWKTGAIGTIIGLFCALMTIHEAACFGFLGVAAISCILFCVSFAYIRRYAYHPHRCADFPDELERRGFRKVEQSAEK